MILFLVSWRPSSQRASRTKWPSIPASENSRARAMATDLPKPRLAPVITQQVREPEGNIFLFSEMQKWTGVPKTLLGSRAGKSSLARDARIATPNSRVLRLSLEMENLFYTLSHWSRLFPYPYNNPKLSKLMGCIANPTQRERWRPGHQKWQPEVVVLSLSMCSRLTNSYRQVFHQARHRTSDCYSWHLGSQHSRCLSSFCSKAG